MYTEYTDQDILDNMELVYKLAGVMASRHKHILADFDDLVSEGILGLVKAIQRFDPEKKVKFSTWASRCIKYAMIDAHRNAFRQYRVVKRWGLPKPSYLYLDDIRTFSADDDGGIPNHELLRGESPTEDEMIDAIDSKLVVEKAWDRLTPRQQKIMRLTLEKGLTQQDAAVEIGVSSTAVHLQFHKALEKIRDYHLKFRPGSMESGRP